MMSRGAAVCDVSGGCDMVIWEDAVDTAVVVVPAMMFELAMACPAAIPVVAGSTLVTMLVLLAQLRFPVMPLSGVPLSG